MVKRKTGSPVDLSAADHWRKMIEGLKWMAVWWPVVVVLIVYLRYFAEKGETLTHIVALVLVVALLVAAGASWTAFEHWREHRDIKAIEEAKSQEQAPGTNIHS